MMNGTLSLRENFNLREDQKPDISALVQSASRVIAPLGPIRTFAARSPFAGLEEQPFEQVARWLKDNHDVDIYPSASMLLAARERGEVDSALLEDGLSHWLRLRTPDLSREVSEKFCRAALELGSLPSELLLSPELKSLASQAGSLGEIKLPFRKAKSVQTYSQLLERQGAPGIAHELDCHMIKWCKLFLGTDNAAWPLPHREKGFYAAWRRLVQHDPALPGSVRRRFRDWPNEANGGLIYAFIEMSISESEMREYLEAHLLSLPGWAGMMLWRQEQSYGEASLLLEYLAVRISLEWALIQPYLLSVQKPEDKALLTPLIAAWMHWGGLSVEEWGLLSLAERKERLELAARFDDLGRRKIWLEAWEKTYEKRLKKVISSRERASNQTKPTLAQFSFCLDVRSEPIRRKLEQAGPFETFGMAGFFGLPIETSELGRSYGHSSLPVMQKPVHQVKEFSPLSQLQSYQGRLQAATSVHYSFKAMKQNLLTNLLLPEVSGPLLSLQMITQSFQPRRAGCASRRILKKWLGKPATKFTLDPARTKGALPVGFSHKEKVHYVRQALKMMGLTEHFAPLVVFCGHGSHSTNNPYAAALDCGACGGASGSFNARVLATLCNLKVVRKALVNEGISIPDDTVFAAAEHITTVNELRFLYVPKLSDAAREAFRKVQSVLENIRREVNEEQLSRLPDPLHCVQGANVEAERRAQDWSEVRPEWGLARNAAFIIGNRNLTEGCNLDGRVFLHNYDWLKDEDGRLLANIVAGPGTVAQWINLQYYASTVAPHYYGSGNKATQTVTGGIGVMQGNASDLLPGLPWQSVMITDGEAYHAPLRLLLVIVAPEKYVERLLRHDASFRQKIQNGWMRLSSVDPQGNWKAWS